MGYMSDIRGEFPEFFGVTFEEGSDNQDTVFGLIGGDYALALMGERARGVDTHILNLPMCLCFYLVIRKGVPLFRLHLPASSVNRMSAAGAISPPV